MARHPSEPIKTDQIKFFIHNYELLLTTLNVTAYDLRAKNVSLLAKKRREALDGVDDLPPYQVLIRCSNLKKDPSEEKVASKEESTKKEKDANEFTPTVLNVRKLVDFWNANLIPEVTFNDFLSKNMEENSVRKRPKSNTTLQFEKAFLTDYIGLYWSPRPGEVVWSFVSIYSEEQPDKNWYDSSKSPTDNSSYDPKRIRAIFIRSQAELDRQKIKICSEIITEYKHTQTLGSEYIKKASDNSLKIYTGPVEISTSSLTVIAHEYRDPLQKLFLALEIDQFLKSTHQQSRPYNGGCGFLLSNGEPEANVMMSKIALVRNDFLPSQMTQNQKNAFNLIEIMKDDALNDILEIKPSEYREAIDLKNADRMLFYYLERRSSKR